MNTCVSLGCPFTHVCKYYNYLVNRGEKCETQMEILKQADKLRKRERAEEKLRKKIPAKV